MVHNLIVKNLLTTLYNCDLGELTEKNIQLKNIKKENEIDKNNNEKLVSIALELYKKTNEKICFLQILYQCIGQFYGEHFDMYINISGSKNNIPEIKCINKSYLQQKYNIQLYMIYKLLDDVTIRSIICSKSKEREYLSKINGILKESTELDNFLINIHIYIYTIYNEIASNGNFFNKLDDYFNTLIILEEKANQIIEIRDLTLSNDQKIKKFLELSKTTILGKKQKIFYAENYENNSNTNSLASSTTQSNLVKSVLSGIDSLGGISNLSKYTSFEALVASYGKHIRTIGSNKSIRTFLPIGSILNYHPPNLNSHFSGKSRTPEEKETYFQTRKRELKQNIKSNLTKFPIINIIDIKTYEDLRDLLENQESFYINEGTKFYLFLSNTTIINLSESMKSDSNKPIETLPIHLIPEHSLSRNSIFGYEIDNIESYMYNNIETADYHLVLDGQNRYQVIRQVFMELLKEKALTVNQIFIDTLSYYQVPSKICDKAIQIRDKLNFTGYVQSNSSKNSLDPEHQEKTKLLRNTIDYCGTEKRTKSDFTFGTDTSVNEAFLSSRKVEKSHTD